MYMNADITILIFKCHKNEGKMLLQFESVIVFVCNNPS